MALPAAPSTLPPRLQRPDINLTALHFLTGIPVALLKGYVEGLFKPARPEREALTLCGEVTKDMSPLVLGLYLDRQTFRLLRTFLTYAEVATLKSFTDYEGYRLALAALRETRKDEFEQAIAKNAKKNGYVAPIVGK